MGINLDYLNLTMALVVLSVMFILLVFSLKYRKRFREHYPRLGRAYDWMILAWLGFSLAKLSVLPVDLSRLGFVDISENHFVKMEMYCNVMCGIALVILIYGWFHMLKGILGDHKLVPIVEVSTEKIHSLEPGLYLVGHKVSLEYLKKLFGGRAAVIVSRKHPKFFREVLGIEKTPVLWLTGVDDKEAVHPRRLEYLVHVLVQFMKRGEFEKLVYLDGIEYLITENGFTSVFKFLSYLKDQAVINNTIVLVPLEPKSLGDKELNLLIREFEMLGNTRS